MRTNMSVTNIVYLQCFKVNNRLRVRIISNNYATHLNCQFPRGLRIENKIYSVPAGDIKLVKRQQHDFYFVGKKNIELIDENIGLGRIKIFAEEDNDTCCICLDNKKYHVFIPCGHFYVCKSCQDDAHFSKCPICRSIIIRAVPFDDLKQ